MNLVQLSRGKKLFFEGEPSKFLYRLTAGKLLVMKGDILICELDPPAHIGELGCILKSPRSTSVFAKTACTLEAHDGTGFLEDMKLETDEGRKFLDGMATRFEVTLERVKEFQFKINAQILKILAVLVADKQAQGKSTTGGKIKELRAEMEDTLRRIIKHDDAAQDYDRLMQMADKYAVDKQLAHVLSGQFRSFRPMDLKPFKIALLHTYINFKAAAEDIAGKIVVLTRYLSDFQTLDLGPISRKIAGIEKNLSFEAREQLLRKILTETENGRDEERRIRTEEFSEAIAGLTAEPNHVTLSLLPVATCFDLDQAYLKSLEALLKTHVKPA